MPRRSPRRRSSWSRKGPEIAGWLALVALVLAGVALFYLPQDLHAHRQALDLLSRGTVVSTDQVRVHVASTRYSKNIDDVEVSYTIGGREITTSLAGMPSDSVELPSGWHPAPAGSAYSDPLEVLVSPADPHVAMAVADAAYWRHDPTLETVAVAGSGLTVASVLGIIAFRSGRYRGRHQTDPGPCAPGSTVAGGSLAG